MEPGFACVTSRAGSGTGWEGAATGDDQRVGMSMAVDADRPGGRGDGFVRVIVGLGSNEGDRLDHLRRAVASIDAGALPRCPAGSVAEVSAVYETRPVGPDPTLAGGPYLNAAICVHADRHADPEALVDALLRLEAEHRRQRRARWAARTLDLDLLLVLDRDDAGDTIVRRVESPRVTLPHPRMPGRDFVLAPLSDLLPDARVLDGDTVAERLARLPDSERTVLRRIDAQLR